MTSVHCPLCGSTGPHRVLEDSEPPYRVMACPVCDYGFVHPLPGRERLAEAYDEAYYEPWRTHDVTARERMWRWRLEQVRSMVCEGRLLEIGAGDGDFLAMAVAAGYEVTATEFSEAAVANIQQKFPQIRVYTGEIEDIGLKAETFDVIVAWHSLEHMRFPFKALTVMYETLNSGGSLLIAVPNRNNYLMRFLYRIARNRRYPLFSLHTKEIHLSHFTPRSLKRAVESAGFETRSIVRDHAMVEFTKRIIDDVAAIPTMLGGDIGTEAMLLKAMKRGG